jgi:hypothetical protein
MASYRTPGPAGVAPTSPPIPSGLRARAHMRDPGTIASEFRHFFLSDDISDRSASMDFSFSLEQGSGQKSQGKGRGANSRDSTPAESPPAAGAPGAASPGAGAARGAQSKTAAPLATGVLRILHPGQILVQQVRPSGKAKAGPANARASTGKPAAESKQGNARRYVVLQPMPCLELLPGTSKKDKTAGAAGKGDKSAPAAAAELLMPPHWEHYVLLFN